MVDILSLLSLLFCTLPVVVLFLYIKCFYVSFRVLKKNGIDGPRPSFFYGNYKDRVKVGSIKYLHQLHEEYGKIVGLYVGQTPHVTVTDLELIKLIFIKDFDCFMDRPAFPGIPDGFFTLRGDAWKSARQILSPTFSSFKLKAMTPIILKHVEVLVDVFRGHAGTDKSFEVFKVFGSFTMENIFATGLGQELSIQKGQSDPLTEAGKILLSGTHEAKTTSVTFWRMIFSNFPQLMPVIGFLNNWSTRGAATRTLRDAAKRSIEEHRKEKNSEKYKDLLQLMIDATTTEVDGSGKTKKLTDSQIVGNAVAFMLAGYETTANTLSYASYLLALNPHIQGKLQEEIDTYLEDNPEASPYQATQDLDYLDMVLQEVLRLYPSAPLTTRECTTDYNYNEITIPKGATVLLCATVLHRDPEIWTDPDSFNPLRFTAEEKANRPQLSYTPFGHGPRRCIGMRFAVLVAKLALLELLRRFSFIRTSDTQVPLETVIGMTMMPKDGIYLKVVARDFNSTQ